MRNKTRTMTNIIVLSTIIMTPQIASAHCPLCTAGAGALAVAAASLGVSSVVVGILIGAFAYALGLWLSSLNIKRVIPYQKEVLTLGVFFSTVMPLIPLMRDYGPWYVAFGGQPYGTLLHNTYTVNLFLVGVALGSLIVFIAPYLSRIVTALRNKQVPFQGLGITLGLLIISSVIVQVFS